MAGTTDAAGNAWTRGCAPCHPAIDTIMTDVAAGPAGLVAVGWIIQGFRGASWSSVDGVTWSFGPPFPDTTLLAAVAADDSRYVAVGRDGEGGTAWSSTDGRTWRRTASTAAFAPAPIRLTSLVHWRSGFLAGGFVGGDFGTADAAFWRSTDGLAWRRVAGAPGLRAARVVGVAVGAGGLVAVGQAGPSDHPGPAVAWTSPDGLAWTRVADSPSLHGARMRSIAYVPGIGFVAVGEELGGSVGIVWTSPDGRAWTRVAAPPSFGRPGIQVRMYDVVAGPHGAVVVGTVTEGLQYGAAIVWTSADGVTWSSPRSGPEFLDTEMNGAARWGSRVVAVGDRGAPDAYQSTAWVSPPDVGR